MISYTYRTTVNTADCLSAVVYASDQPNACGNVVCNRRRVRRWLGLRPRQQTDREFVDEFHRAVLAKITKVCNDRTTSKKLIRLTRAGVRLETPPNWPDRSRRGVTQSDVEPY